MDIDRIWKDVNKGDISKVWNAETINDIAFGDIEAFEKVQMKSFSLVDSIEDRLDLPFNPMTFKLK